jgi:hypothetical protein
MNRRLQGGVHEQALPTPLCCCTDHHLHVKRHPSAASADPETLQRNSNQLPEYIEEFLDYGNALSCAFNPFGTLLASESYQLLLPARATPAAASDAH